MNAALPHDPTGRRFTIASGDAVVEITEVGAALRAFEVGGVDLVPRYGDDQPTPAASGVVLVPWPNRVRDGRWTQRGQEHQLALTEPARGNASHGLLRVTPYRLVTQEADAVTLAADVFPQTGYPFHLATTVTYALDGPALTVTHTLRNVGAADAPVALGTHPYFCIGDVPTRELTLQIDAATRFVVDDRMLPIDEVPVDADTDLRTPRRLADVDLDTAYSGISRDDEGRIGARLAAPDGRAVHVWADEGFGYLLAFSTDRYPGHELALAIEPMTAPTDALNSGRDLRWLAPGEEWTLRWGVAYHTP
ncbi:aldose 1-epimerase family protein [Microbacterium sp. No. 7]|uniref:aldose 1-epimerase family protein n=1 Tax=Microbacterium sp. No. 7 TaxID=1714373 RepID=UPI0006CF7177|nr:aldose 1-epimerase family protein [Microbacterium sp. No. 7]ALJ22126.1 galactose mutarotase [Microbacterium sp. No. 7]